MTDDARFEDAREAPIALIAHSPEDVPVISALLQDAVFPASEMRWERSARRFAMLINRFRWEDGAASAGRRPAERVRSLLVVADVVRVATQGMGPREADTVLSLLSVEFVPGEDGTGDVLLTLAGDGAVRIGVECLDLTLRDVTRPYLAPSRRVPGHPE